MRVFSTVSSCFKIVTLVVSSIFVEVRTQNIFTSQSLLFSVPRRSDLFYSTMADNFNHSSKLLKCSGLAKRISEWHFCPSSLTSLPLDTIEENYIRRHVKNAVFSKVTPTPLRQQLDLVAISEDALVNILDMDPEIAKDEDFVAFVAGNKVLSSSIPLAHRYGGHQFGVWAAQLGDGRAILLGEYKNSAGERWELQLKGAGLTPYSRGGDGRAVLRSSIREFLCAEAMHYLRVPTSRVAAIIAGGDSVVRDPLYQGHPIAERTAVVLRLAPTWFRIGSLEIHAHLGEVESLRSLVHHVIASLFSHEEWSTLPVGEQYVQLGVRVANLCYDTWVHWQRVGFTHGVLNSDNISLLGITIDYGPFGFLSAYNPRYVPNNSDSEGRYSYERQLDMLHFDLDKLRSSLEVLIAADVAPGEQRGLLLQRMAREFTAARARAEDELQRVFLAKLGLRGDVSDNLPAMLLLAMEETGADFTATFRQLGEVDSNRLGDKSELKKHWSLNRVASSDLWPSFVERYVAALHSEGVSETDRRDVMNHQNPCYVLRNWMAQAAIEKAEKLGDFSEVRRLERILRDPYTRQTEAEHLGYAAPPPDWEKQLRVSCSS